MQTFKYIACGSTTVLVDYITFQFGYYILFAQKNIELASHTFSPQVAASVLSFMFSFPTGFILNKYIAFAESELRGRVQLFRYALSVFSCFIFSIFFIKLFMEFCHFKPGISKILTIIVVAVYSYFAQQYFTFKVKGRGFAIKEQTPDEIEE